VWQNTNEYIKQLVDCTGLGLARGSLEMELTSNIRTSPEYILLYLEWWDARDDNLLLLKLPAELSSLA